LPIAAAVRTHLRRAGSARRSSAARHRTSHLPATVITQNGGNPVTNTWSYNRRRLPTAETQTPDGTRSWSLTYGYNAQGQRTSETAPDNVITTHTVNALGQTTQISVKVKTTTTTVASNASYYPNGALQQFTYGNGITHTLTQNARQLPQHSQDGSVLDLTTTFDENGNVASIVDGTANARQSRSMTYDGLDRLTQVQSPMFGTASYGYDEQDNLRHVGISGGSQPRDHTYCYSADNRLEFVRSGPNCTGNASPAVIALGYDVQGNLQYKNGTAYSFDYGNRLRGTANRNYRYDAAGRRVRTDSAGSQLQYSDYAGDGRLVWQRDEAAGKRINNIYLAGSLVAEVSRSLATDAATYRYVHTDALGSPIAKTSSTGAVLETSEYEPYGQLLNRANDDRAGYTGHVMDAASGLTYMQQRYLDPAIGRFLSVDPVTAYDNPIGAFNRYWYANNNPYRFTDPDGRQSRREAHEDRERAARCNTGCNVGSFSSGSGVSSRASAPERVDWPKVGSAIGNALNSSRLMASGLAKLGIGELATDTGAGAPPGLLTMAWGAWNLRSSAIAYQRAEQQMSEAFSAPAQRQGLGEHARAFVGMLPWGTEADDPGEPSYQEVVRSHVIDLRERPTHFLSELGTLGF